MYRSQSRPAPLVFELAAVALAVVLASCTVGDFSGPRSPTRTITRPVNAQLALECTATIASPAVSCQSASANKHEGAASADVIGGQNVYVKLTSSNVSYNSGTETFSFDATVQNLLIEALGSPDGQAVDPAGIKVFFRRDPVATSGSGTISVANADGVDFFTGANQPYFQYSGKLAHNEVSPAKTWQLHIPSTVGTFTFQVYLSAMVEAKLVINEVMANPTGPVTGETPSEWFEVYNAGTLPVDMHGFVIADSAASGRRPYHVISLPLVVRPGEYVVLGGSANTTSNLGVPVDYEYGTALQLANSLDAVKVSRLVDDGSGNPPDTVTISRTQYSQASISAKEGISRELKNPALDNSNMDGSNWADATVTSVYGAGGRGTPKAQNSTYTP